MQGMFSIQTMRRALLLALRCCAAALLVGGGAATASAADLPPVRLGLIESLSGPFANTGEAVLRNLQWAVERNNARGGVHLTDGWHKLELLRYDSKGQSDTALALLKAAQDDKVSAIAQGNSSAVALALVDALERHNAREPDHRMLFLNYSAVDPTLTNEHCSFWHFRFDAHVDMRMAALMDVLRGDRSVHSVYLIGQDYSFGHAVLREARRQLKLQRPDIQIVGDELHAVGRVKDFAPYASKIVASGAQAVITGNWGNDLTLLIKAAREQGYGGKFYTFYGNALGAPAAVGQAGIGKVLAVAEWMPNHPQAAARQMAQAFRARYPKPEEDYLHLRMQMMVDAWVQAMERAGSADAVATAQALEGLQLNRFGFSATMRKEDHQWQQPLMVGQLERAGKGQALPFDVEGSGLGFRIIHEVSALTAAQPWSCKMQRPKP